MSKMVMFCGCLLYTSHPAETLHRIYKKERKEERRIPMKTRETDKLILGGREFTSRFIDVYKRQPYT